MIEPHAVVTTRDPPPLIATDRADLALLAVTWLRERLPGVRPVLATSPATAFVMLDDLRPRLVLVDASPAFTPVLAAAAFRGRRVFRFGTGTIDEIDPSGRAARPIP